MAIALKFPLGGHLSGAGGAGPRRLIVIGAVTVGAIGVVFLVWSRSPPSKARPIWHAPRRQTRCQVDDTPHPPIPIWQSRTTRSLPPVRRHPAKAPLRPCQVAKHRCASRRLP